MEVKFQLAKNNEETVMVNNCFLHSSYNPVKEAERFVENISIPYKPEYIIVIEPALSYCATFLKKKFPDTKIGAIRIINDFNKYNSCFDFIIKYDSDTSTFESNILNTIGEENLLKVFFINWKSSESVLKEEFTSINNTFSKLLNESKTLLVTRQYFERKWFLNSINFIINIKKAVCFNGKINKPILIVSSGPSLIDVIPIIKTNRNLFFIICLSSAISVCKKNDIIPDLYMSTDGGYWAGQHLKRLPENIPLALPLEAYINKSDFNNVTILPLKYSDSLLNDFISKTNVIFEKAERNGTVSGTAFEYALNKSDFPVFLTGIDMANQKGYQHTQPNEIELNNSLSDNHIFSKELRSVKSEYSQGSLEIYKNWFQKYNLKNKSVYRIINEDKRKNKLGNIKDINPAEFNEILKSFNIKNNDYSFDKQNIQINIKELETYINNIYKTDIWYNQFFPLDILSLSYNPANEELKNKIEDRSEKFYKKIMELLNG